MNNILLSPPVAFIIYLILVSLLSYWASKQAATSEDTPGKRTIYSSGEISPGFAAAPGYRPFFVVALFFAVVHLGMLVAATNGLSTQVIIYIVGLILALIALILG